MRASTLYIDHLFYWQMHWWNSFQSPRAHVGKGTFRERPRAMPSLEWNISSRQWYILLSWLQMVENSFVFRANHRNFLTLEYKWREENSLTASIISLVFFLPPGEKLKRFKVQLILNINTVSCSLTRPPESQQLFQVFRCGQSGFLGLNPN